MEKGRKTESYRGDRADDMKNKARREWTIDTYFSPSLMNILRDGISLIKPPPLPKHQSIVDGVSSFLDLKLPVAANGLGMAIL